jgi:hypothetical protein
MIARAWNLLQRGWLRYTIHETEAYLRACERDGLVNSLSLTDFRAQLEAQRVQLADLQPRPTPLPTRADGAPAAAEACTELGADVITLRFLAPRRTLLMALSVTVVIAGTAVFA